MLLNKVGTLEYMRRFQLHILVATSPVDINYFSAYYGWLDSLFKEYMMVPGASSQLAQRYAVVSLEGEPALGDSPLFAVNSADLWVKDPSFFGSTGLDFSLRPGTLSDHARHLLVRLYLRIPNATPKDVLMRILKARGLAESRIGATRLDVFEQEPTPLDSPLLKLDNVVVTSHIAGYSDEFWSNFWWFSVEMVIDLSKGLWPHCYANRDIKPRWTLRWKANEKMGQLN